MRGKKLAALVALLAALSILSLACAGETASTPPASPAPTVVTAKMIKPAPSVVSVVASTLGMFDNYYAIVEVTVRNDGADGMVVVFGSITQGGETKESELPTYIVHNGTQTVKLVFPLKWKGGAWTPKIEVGIP